MASHARIWTFLAISLVIQGAVTCVSDKVSDSTLLELEDAQQQCIEWTSREDTKTMLRNVSRQLACPCNTQLIQYDINFRKNGRCYEEFFFQDGVKLICCYSENGLLKNKGAGRGYILHENYQQSIKQFHKLCCLNEATCTLLYDTVPFDNCKNYQSPAVAQSWGDAHIQPVAGEMYDFNGHGEYIFLDVDEGAFVIQCRLEYISEDNTDATILTAFALKVNGSNPLEVMLNRTTGQIIYNNTIDGRLPFMMYPPQLNKTQLQVGVRMEHFLMIFRFNGGADLTITLDQRQFKSHIVKGLAGNTTDGYRLGNDTLFPTEANATLIYDFGQSWRLSNLSESIFLYNEAWNFTYYNKNVKKPRLPGDYLNNITNMFTIFGNYTETEIQEFQNLCNVSDKTVVDRCLLSIARTNKIDDANDVITKYTETLKLARIQNMAKDLKPQFISEFPNNIRLKLNLETTFVLEICHYVHDNDTNDTLTYDVTTEVNITIDKTTGTLTINVDESLRDYNGSILVGVTDKLGKKDHQELQIQFCGCEHPSQCASFTEAISDASSTSVQQTQCTCGKYFKGPFCETKLDVCTITNCYPNVTCDNTTDVFNNNTHPCGPCPSGYSGNGIECEDINECTSYTSNTCAQICNNTIGSYTCSCKYGYTKNGSSCQDIDECKQKVDNCGKKESYTECVNTPGSFSCACIDEYSRDSRGKCSFDTGKYVYIGQLNLTPRACDMNVELQELSLKKHLHLLRPINDTDFANVVLINKTSINGSARENVIFGLHTHKNLNWTDVQSRLDEHPDILWNITNNHGTICEVVGNKHLFNETENMLCKTLDKIKCDQTKSDCVQRNGESLCECKEGYEHEGKGPTDICYDVDECLEEGFNCSNNGKCSNIIGNWTCHCPTGYTTRFWNYTTITCEDLDECLDNSTYMCRDGTCTNSVGSWDCKCNAGYLPGESFVNFKSCNDVDECAAAEGVDCTNKGTCRNIIGNWTCDCPKGFTTRYWGYTNITCEDVDECATNGFACLNNGTCKNTIGNWTCGCPEGFSTHYWDYNNITCEDINECETKNKTYLAQHCVHGKCSNTVGSWNCSCPDHTHLMVFDDDTHRCQGNFSYFGQIEINTTSAEFLSEDVVHAYIKTLVNNSIVESKSSLQHIYVSCNIYECLTQSYTSNGSSVVVSIYTAKFVLRFGDPIGNMNLLTAALNVTYMKYTPISNDTVPKDVIIHIYTDTDNLICQATFGNKCELNTTFCQSSNGEYNCTCKEGYTNKRSTDKQYSCEDVDECAAAEGFDCSNKGTCRNKNGNWTCDCPKGFTTRYWGYNNITCEDVDECVEEGFDCSNNGTCINSIGNWTCGCQTGYTTRYSNYTTVTCEDLDECLDNTTYMCRHGTCNNTIGSWDCKCYAGYQPGESFGNVKLCNDINECETKTQTYFAQHCVHGTCYNTVGSWNCSCQDHTQWMVFDDGIHRCQGNFSYFGQIKINTTSTEILSEDVLHGYVDTLVHDSINESKTSLAHLYVSCNMYETLNQSYKSNGSSIVGRIYTAKFVLRFGDPIGDMNLLTATLNVTEMNYTSISNGTIPIAVTIHMYKDTDNLICKAPFGNQCELNTTSCQTGNGDYTCSCKEGYQKSSGGNYSCEDVDECSTTTIHNSCTSTNGTCNNSQGNWTCACQDGYKTKYYNYENITCEDINECDVDNRCIHGTCKNNDGGFECECPKDLGTKVTNASTGITTCIGSNHYQCNMTMSFKKELNETDKIRIATELAFQIRKIYKQKFGDVSVIVTVTIEDSRDNTSSHRRKRRGEPTYPYRADTNTYLNATKSDVEMSHILKNETTVHLLAGAIQDLTKNSMVEATLHVSKVSITLPQETPECTKNCRNGGTCTQNGNDQTCSCPHSYHGVLCEVQVVKQSEDPTNDKDTILYASVGSLGGLIVFMAIVIVVVCRRASIKRQKAKDDMYMDSVSNKNNRVSLYRGNVYVPAEDMTTAFDNRASHRFSIPRIDPYAVTEPKPDYGPPQTFVKPGNYRPGSPNPDYHTERQGSPKPDYKRSGSPIMRRSRDERLPRISVASRDSGMDISKGSIGMDRHNRNNIVDNSLYAQVDRRPPRVMSNHL